MLRPHVLTHFAVQKIKRDLIHKAKLKKSYAKLKAREQDAEPRKSVYEREEEDTEEPQEALPEPNLEPHPDRVKMLEDESAKQEDDGSQVRRPRRPRPQPFSKEAAYAQKRKEEAQARQKAREEAEKERQKKMAERERFRKAMAKARGGPDGKRKLGREAPVLLEKVKRLIGNT